MDLRGDDFKRTTRAPAKLNLFLEVLGTRRDGFHDLETLMVPLCLADQVSFAPTPAATDGSPGELRLVVHAAWPVCSSQQGEIPTGPANLVIQALELLRQRTRCALGASVELTKRVPVAAGMGGGSSDAAAALRLANHGWRLNWSNDQLTGLAAELGSDVPFFLSHGAAICRGRGEQVERLPPLHALHFVIVKPEDSLGAGEVYKAHDSLAASPPKKLTGEFVSSSWRNIGAWMHNRLQAAASVLSPSVEKLRHAFDELDFVAHQLTGSGSAYFGLCRHAQHARRLASILRTRQLGVVYATRSCQ